MNALASRFRPTLVEDDVADETAQDVGPALWGSQGGFGNLQTNAPPQFALPNVANVCTTTHYVSSLILTSFLLNGPFDFIANGISAIAYRRPRRSRLQNQNCTWYYHSRFPFQGRHYCRSRLESHSGQLHWYANECNLDGAISNCFPCSASGTVKKVIEINKYLLGTMAGGAGTRRRTPP